MMGIPIEMDDLGGPPFVESLHKHVSDDFANFCQSTLARMAGHQHPCRICRSL